MPEGDTIRRLADRIQARFAGQRCERCVTRDPRLVGVDLAGATLVAADARGKHLLLRFDDGRTVHSHLRMDGSWDVGRASSVAEWRRRIELWFADGRLTGIDLPVLGVLPTSQEDRIVGRLGPDLCAPQPPDLGEIVDRFGEQPDALLAAAMLDQQIVAGFGNVYAVEVPFIVGVSPSQPVGTIDGLDHLVAVGAALIRTITRLGGPRNTTGRSLRAPNHWVYGRRGRPCPLCGTADRRLRGTRVSVAAGGQLVPVVSTAARSPCGRPRPGAEVARPPSGAARPGIRCVVGWDRNRADLIGQAGPMRFVIHAEDKPDSLDLRVATREQHLAYVAGFELLVTGPLLDAEGNMCGSLLILEADDLAAAEAFAAGDPYRRAGLFARVSVHAWRTGTWPV